VKSGCILRLVATATLAVAYYFLTKGRLDWPLSALVPGFFAALVAGSGIGYGPDIPVSLRHARHIARAMSGAPREDGAVVAVTGSIEPIGPALKTPFTDRDCVAYRYKAVRGIFTGVALAPCGIRTSTGLVRLLGFPQLDGFPLENVDDPVAIQNGIGYLENESIVRGKFQAADLFVDDNGAIRKDHLNKVSIVRGVRGKNQAAYLFKSERGKLSMQVGERADLALQLLEQYVGVGESVCAVGRYSAAAGGLIPDEVPSPTMPYLIKGEPNKVISRLRWRALRCSLGLFGLLGTVHYGLWHLACHRGVGCSFLN
jgi:hypothetical protein